MRFLFDLVASQPVGKTAFHGGGKYAHKVFLAILAYKKPDFNLYALYDSSKKMDNQLMEVIVKSSVTLLDIHNRKLNELLIEYQIERLYTALPFALIKYGLFDVAKSTTAVYVTIHGLRPLELKSGLYSLKYNRGFGKDKIRELVKIIFSKKFENREIKRYNYLIANTNVIAVSKHTKYSLLNFFPATKKNVKVFYSPDVTELTDGDMKEPPIININNEKYFLLVSGDRWLKNGLASAIALDEVLTEQVHLSFKILVTGISDSKVYLSKLKNKDSFVFLNYVDNAQLSYLFKHAYAFLYLSLNEGFGYPPLEAMKFSVPCITSPFSSLSEILADAVLYANPYSVSEIKNRILQLFDTKIYEDFYSKSKAQFELINDKQKIDLVKMINYLTDFS